MNPLVSDLLGAAIIGIGATLIMDFWAFFSRRYLGFAPPNYCLVGRWFCHMSAGKWRHQNIVKSAAVPGECRIGWFIHYAIGALYGMALVALTSGEWRQAPDFQLALIFGVATLVFPFLVMQPSFGFGIFSSRVANPREARMKSVLAHTAFGIGLYVSTKLLEAVS